MSGAVPAHLVGDRWRAVRLIARGGMGAVYEAQHHLTGERAALKIVFAHTAFDPIAAERFVREVSLGSEIGHAGIVRVLDAGADARTGALYLAMELLEGETLAARMNRAYDPWGATRAIADVLDPLAAAHAKGVVHRDLKPQNVFLARRPGGGERVVLVDLGLARQMGDAGTTSTQAIVGSPGYIAPEQATSARAATPAADVWAAGVMLYEAWATVQPFRGETPAAMIVATCTTTPAPLATIARGAPPALAALIDRCLDKSPERRPPDAGALRAALLPLLATTTPNVPRPVTIAPRRRSRVPVVLGLGVGIALLGLAAVGATLAYVTRHRWLGASGARPVSRDAGSTVASGVAPDAGAAVAASPGGSDRPPRLVGPLHGSRVTSHRPTLRFLPAEGATATRIEMCADRGCTRALAVFEAPSNRALPPSPLPPGVVHWRARSMSGASPGAATSATWSMIVPARSAANGTVVSTYADLDGDGLSDVAVGMPAARGGQGLVRAFTATRTTGHIGRQMDAPPPPAPLVGLGTTLRLAGDIDGDGHSDLVAGAPDSKAGAGAAVTSYGAPNVLRNGYALLEGADHFGHAVAGVGDVDADGYADIAIASGGTGRARGAVIIALGSAGGPTASTDAMAGIGDADERFGTSVAGAGDVDGDGHADVLVGAPGAFSGAGRVYLVLGGPRWRSVSELRAIRYESPEPDVGFGTVVAGVGDLDGDGFADVAVGAPTHDRVYVFWGSRTGLQADQIARVMSPAGTGIRFGAAIAGLGDLDGDGSGELVVGAWGHERERGAVYLFEGMPDGISPVRGYAVPPDQGAGARFGWALSGPGDVDGDGLVDLVVGAPGAARGEGRAYVVFGSVAGFADRPLDVLRPLEGGSLSLGLSVL